jgi:hypothetical protein
LQWDRGEGLDHSRLAPATAPTIAIALFISCNPLRANAQPSPYIPPASDVSLGSPRIGSADVSIPVSVLLPDTCHSLGAWGPVTVAGSNFTANAQFWVVNTVCSPVLLSPGTNYHLGALAAGDYTFTFQVWSTPLRSRAFSVPPRLEIERLGAAQARISWPTNNAMPYLLESTAVLPALSWQAVTNTPTVIGPDFSVTIDPSPQPNFFRLRHR